MVAISGHPGAYTRESTLPPKAIQALPAHRSPVIQQAYVTTQRADGAQRARATESRKKPTGGIELERQAARFRSARKIDGLNNLWGCINRISINTHRGRRAYCKILFEWTYFAMIS